VRASISALPSFTPREIARVAGVPVQRVLAELGPGGVSGTLVPRADAIRLVRRLRLAGMTAASGSAAPPLFAGRTWQTERSGVPALVSAGTHAAIVAAVVIAVGIGMGTSAMPLDQSTARLQPIRMVYLAIPGPGGGGGGGGARMRAPAPKAMQKGPARVSSPVPKPAPAPAPAPVEATVKPPELPKVLASESLPPILAPVVSVPADDRSRVGVMETATAEADSRGPGTGGGAGSGSGTGLGEGDGPGIGPGSGGGTGGGTYRPGSGVEPPTILHEVKPTYTEAARARGVTGEVVLEIVVLRNGSVGQIRVVQGLGSGLDERAIEAVRQWRFAPARRLGQPVDVQVEVAVEFRLR
jgi:TonB family protein